MAAALDENLVSQDPLSATSSEEAGGESLSGDITKGLFSVTFWLRSLVLRTTMNLCH